MPENICRHLTAEAAKNPNRRAVVLAAGESLCFAQLEAECDRMAALFHGKGIRSGMRVALFVRPGFEFVPAVYGCFRLGAIPVFIDPGMTRKNILRCIAQVAPHAVVGVLPALLLARLFPRPFATAKIRIRIPRVVAGKIPFVTVKDRHPTQGNDTAAILFTSGSTGVPKGVVYTHRAFDHQQQLLRSAYGIEDHEVDLVVFPLFALFSAAWGITAVIPKMDPARPAKTNGKALATVIRTFGVTHTAGSPAIWKNLSEYCLKSKIELPSLNRILMAGAQVPEKLVRNCAQLARQVHTPYGATEALPLTTIAHKELFETYPLTIMGGGTCVGKPLPGVDVAILPFSDEPIVWTPELRQAPYHKGEIAVCADWVTKTYFGDGAATKRAKISDGEKVWHRMGDVGYLDAEGALWFCGRKDHRIFAKEGVLYPDPIEAIFEHEPGVTKCALVGVGRKGQQQPVLVVQTKGGVPTLAEDLLRLAKQTPLTKPIFAVVIESAFPLDVRHNIKIDRPELARRMAKRLQ